MNARLQQEPLTRSLRRTFWPPIGLLLGLILLLWPIRAFRSESFVFYSPTERHVVRLETIDGASYLPLLETLSATGKISGWQEKKNSLHVWFGGAQLQLKADDRKVKVDKSSRKLLQPVRVSNGQWLVPVDFLISILPQVVHERVVYQLGDRRAFIGDIKPVSVTARTEPLPDGIRLTLQFSGPVKTRVVSQNGKWVVFLGDQPVEVLPVRFQNPYLSGIQFDDQDGVPKLILTPGAEGLNFNPTQAGGTVLVAEITRPAPNLAQQFEKPVPPAPQAPSAAQAPPPSLPVVVLDPGHGGPDSGARSRDGLLEKNVVASLAERVRGALVATNKYRVVVTRPGDADPGFDERAATANAAHPAAYISLHAGNLGDKMPRLVVYSYALSSSAAARPAPGIVRTSTPGARSIFVPWADIQQAHLERSRQLAQALEAQFGKIPDLTTGDPVEAPVRVLRNVDAPAIAIEIGSFSPDVDARLLIAPAFEDRIATAIVRAVEGFLGGQS